MTIQLQARNADFGDMVALLKKQDAVKADVVWPLTHLSSREGILRIKGTGVFEEEGAEFRPTAIADGHLAGKLGIPVAYLRKMRDERVDLYDANVNGWIHGSGPYGNTPNALRGEPDERKVMFRTFMGDVGEEGVLRAILSDRFGIVDNLDLVTALMAGIKETGTPVEILSCDLSERRMSIFIAAPEILVNAPDLMKGYRSPFGREGIYDHGNGGSRYVQKVPQWAQDKFGVNEDGVCAGLYVSNSEVGAGKIEVGPRILFLACLNGAMIQRDAFTKIHIGGKLDEGNIDWSDDTKRKSLELITAQARDAVQAFLDADYVQMALDQIEEKAGKSLRDPVGAIGAVAKTLLYTDEQRDGILDMFIKGGQTTVGGVMQAVTAFAQTVEDPDTAFDLESSAMRALELAYVS